MDNVLKFLIQISSNSGNVVSVVRNVSSQLDNLHTKAGKLKNELNKAFNFDGLKNAFSSIPGAEFLTNPLVMAGAGVTAVANLGAQAESTAVAFKTLVGDETKAGEMLKGIEDFANHSPFGKMELAEGAQQMLSFGVSAEKVLPLMKQLGDVSGGNKDRFASLALVMGQVSSTGYLMGQDLMQFINAGFNPIEELSKMTGKSGPELKNMMSKGQITAENVAQALEHATSKGGKFYGMMEAKSQTLEGRMSTLQDTIASEAVKLSQDINSPIGQLVDQVTSLIPTIFSGLQSIFKAIGAVISFVVKFKDVLIVLGAVAGGLFVVWKAFNAILMAYRVIILTCQVATATWTVVQWALNTAFLASPIGWIVLAVGALTAAIVYAWNNFSGFRAFLITMWDVIKQFGTILKNFLIDRIYDMVTGLGDLASGLLKLFNGDFAGAVASFGEGIKKVSGVNALKTLANSTKDVVSGISSSYNKTLKAEQAKDAKKKKQESTSSSKSTISSPTNKGSSKVIFGEDKKKDKKKKKGKGGRSAEEIATGGKRSMAITMNISKFFDTIHVHMTDKTDTLELERIVVQCLNRSLAIATSTDRG